MSSPERRSTLESLTAFTKKADIVAIIGGLLVGGQFGGSIAVFGGLTYILADMVERRQKK